MGVLSNPKALAAIAGAVVVGLIVIAIRNAAYPYGANCGDVNSDPMHVGITTADRMFSDLPEKSRNDDERLALRMFLIDACARAPGESMDQIKADFSQGL